MGSSSYPPHLRLRHKPDFQRVLHGGLIYPGAQCLVRVLENGQDHPRLGIAAPRRYGKAIRRNRFRRLVREAFRALQQDLGSLDVMVSPRKGLETPTLAGLLSDLRAAPRAARPQRPGRGPRRKRPGRKGAAQ